MWKRIECLAIYSDDIEESVEFYQSLELTKAWEPYQNEENEYKLIGMRFPNETLKSIFAIQWISVLLSRILYAVTWQ